MVQPLINITRNQALFFAFFLVFYEFLTYTANDMIMPGMIHVVQSFHAPESNVANSLTAYVLGGASLQLFLGPLSDRFGRRPVMLLGVSLFFLCTLFIAFSQSMEQFILIRFFQGMGLCFIGVIGYATLQEIFAETDAVRLIAIMANVSILAPLLGPLLGSVVIHFFDWRVIFKSIGLFSLIALWGLWFFMPESVGQIKKDGSEIKVVSLQPQVILSNYWQLFKNHTFMLASIANGLIAVPCLAWIALSPIILMTEAKLTVIQYALWQIPVFTASILGNWFLHYLTGRLSLQKILFMGSCIAVFSLLLCGLFAVAIHPYFVWLMPGLILYFFGLSMCGGPLQRIILFSTPVAKGTASALMTLIIMGFLGGGIEIANLAYAEHNNLHFALFCGASGIAYLMFISLAFVKKKKHA